MRNLLSERLLAPGLSGTLTPVPSMGRLWAAAAVSHCASMDGLQAVPASPRSKWEMQETRCSSR